MGRGARQGTAAGVAPPLGAFKQVNADCGTGVCRVGRSGRVLTSIGVIELAAVVPHPPLLVPELVGGAAAETAPLRAACESAANRLVAAGIVDWLAVAADPSGPRRVPPSAAGTFAGYGVDVPVALGARCRPAGAEADRLPLPMLVAGWLRGRVSADVVVTGELIAPSSPAAECAARGRQLVEGLPGRVGLLVLGDGSSRHPAPGAGRVDERAVRFDATVRDALATADTAALLGMDERLAAELDVAGRPAWQLLAGAAEWAWPAWRGELLYSAAPYGVAYHVAVWRPVR